MIKNISFNSCKPHGFIVHSMTNSFKPHGFKMCPHQENYGCLHLKMIIYICVSCFIFVQVKAHNNESSSLEIILIGFDVLAIKIILIGFDV